jgi:integration host factor subunit alpha
VALTKEDLVNSVRNHLDLTKAESDQLVESLLEIIKSTLENGEDVMISGFGKFCVKEKKDRRGRNPQTGEALTLDARRVVVFRCSSVLRERINGIRRGFGYSE